MAKWKRLLSTAVMFSPSLAAAQSEPSDYTYYTRYDAAGRVIGTIAPDPDGPGPLRYAAVRNTYDSAGRLAKVEKGVLSDWLDDSKVPSGWTGFEVQLQSDTVYDAINRKVQERVSSGGTSYTVTQFGYEASGRLSCTAQRMNVAQYGSLPGSACDLGPEGTQGPDRITRDIYNAAGQLLQVRKAVGTALEQAEVTYSYTPNGQQDYIIDANGNRARKMYDGYDRLQQWQFPSQAPVSGFDSTTPASALNTAGAVNSSDYEKYSYDANSNRTSLQKRDGKVIVYQYDRLNRVTKKTVPESASGAAGYTVFYGYDLRGLQTYARYGSSGGQGINSGYDGFGALISSESTMGGVSRVLKSTYDANGNRKSLTYPNGTVVKSVYDGLDRMIALKDSADNDLTIMTYYPNGRRGWRGYGANGTGYSYDPILRLGSYNLQRNQGGTVVGDLTNLSYNPASQISQQTRSSDAYAWMGAVNVDRPYVVNGLNQYERVNGTKYSYDTNGNLTSDGSTTFTYDAENRLVGATGGRTATLSYDPLGRLWQVGNGQTSTRFVYDRDALVAEYDTTNTLLNRYVHADGSDEPVLWYQGANSSPFQLFADHQGSIISITQNGWSLVQRNTYDEYGIRGPDNVGRFQYTGQVFLPELGFYYYKARIYAPTLGRFLQTDPIGYDDQFNLYAYVANDPVNRTDPSGLCGYRYKDGTCQVKVDSKLGEAGSAAGKALEARLNKYDARVKATDPKATIAIKDAKGNQVGSMTGKQLQNTWNNQRFSIKGADTAGRGNMGLGATTPGRTTLSVGAVSDYEAAATARGRDINDGRDTLIFHEIGHALPFGWGINQANPGLPGNPNAIGEAGANNAGRGAADAVGGALQCDITGYCS